MKEYSLRRTVEAEQFDGRTLLAGMTRREVKDSLGYCGLRPGAVTPKGFVPMEGGDWIIYPGPTVLTDVVFDELFAEHCVVSGAVDADAGTAAASSPVTVEKPQESHHS